MRLRASWLWERLSTSYWFVPTVMTLSAGGLAVGLGALDRWLEDPWLSPYDWIWQGGAEGARTLLGAVAGAMITVASTAFSITIVALTLASSQFGPRLLRNFMRDRGNQVVLGTFTATFVYCLLVLRSVRTEAFIPHVSVSVAIALALASVGVLIYFIHHVSVSIHAGYVIAVAGRDLEEALRSEPEGPGLPTGPAPTLAVVGEGAALTAPRSGYLQAIERAAALRELVARDAVMRVEVRPGQFVVRDAVLARVWPPAALDRGAGEALRAAFYVSARRTPLQDLEFAIHEIVEIAVRALSPGINDPFTAISGVDWLGDALCRLAAWTFPLGHVLDDRGALRLVLRPFSFAGAVDAAFHQVRQAGADNPAVLIRMLEVIAIVARCARDEPQRAALRKHVRLIERASQRWAEPEDREDLLVRHAQALACLANADGPPERGRPGIAAGHPAGAGGGSGGASGAS